MAKKIVTDEAKLTSGMIAVREKGGHAIPVAPGDRGAQAFSPSMVKKAFGNVEPEDQPQDDKKTIVAAVEGKEADGAVTAAMPVQAETAEPRPATGSDIAKTGDKDEDRSSGNGGWWLLGGAGLAAVATGIGLAFSGDDSDGSPQGMHSNDTEVFNPANPGSSPANSGSNLANFMPNLGNYAVTLAENSAKGTPVGKVSATDADGDTITYTIIAGNDNGAFAIDAASGAITVADASKLDFEATREFTLTVQASDGRLSDTGTVTINLVDRNDNAPVITSGSSGTVAENAPTDTVIYQAAARDADTETTITYSLKPGEDTSLLTIDPGSGTVTLNNSADFETKTSYTFTVIAGDGVNSSEQAVTVSVLNLNDNSPILTSGAGGSVAENAPISTVIYQAAASDADGDASFTYSLKPGGDADLLHVDSATGAVTLRSLADFESKPGYSFTVAVSDGIHTTEQEIAVSVTDVNEAPVITSNGGEATAAISVSENQAAVTTVTATDVDAGDSRTFSITGGADAALFAIDAETGALTFLAAPDREKPADVDHNNIYDVQVAVTDRGGLSDVQDLAVSVTDVREHVVVEASGTWLDLNANGIRDGEDRIRAVFTPGTGNVDLAAVHGVIHYNNIPSGAIDLNGFGADDRIEIDAQAFIDNGHEGLQILTRPHITTLDAFAKFAISHSGKTDNGLEDLATGTRYFNHNTYEALAAPPRTAGVSLTLHDAGNLHFKSNDGPTAIEGQLASGLPSGVPLQQVVDFVHLPEKPAVIHVVVERDGAVIDTDGDGVRDSGENRLAVFDAGGSADLGGTAGVTVHFNDVPLNALNLTGFGADDKVELDVQALEQHNVLRSATRLAGLTALTTITNILNPIRVGYTFNSAGSSPARLIVRETPLSIPFNGLPANANAVMGIADMGANKGNGALAYWSDSGNALNDARHILPSYTGNNEGGVLETLNSNAPHGGLVDFVWPENVMVDGSGAWIDANGDGRRDAGETTAVDLKGDLAANPVTVHVNGIPTTPLDFSGFGSDDRLVVDMDALRHGNDQRVLASQLTAAGRPWTDGYGFSGGTAGAGGKTGVFLAGNTLKFGHGTPGTGTVSLQYTAAGEREGIIALDARALAHHFDQVMFVDSGAGPA
ncbi:cadherin domain protein [Geotalea daltonii FRC-32]|uniref:Cadherin domain protein n=1 Tax=Geotalea daltonii (strain DSM 22248 / JCM 15807 / FRC-32) TaxID=316067 RepID=B9LZ05_GEODF|nr:cadherin repeat domain-containing protein [Geotalea daltonii]ACM18737.1 cadherin domain protein [Geotalea daltonii FRC-32]